MTLHGGVMLEAQRRGYMSRGPATQGRGQTPGRGAGSLRGLSNKTLPRTRGRAGWRLLHDRLWLREVNERPANVSSTSVQLDERVDGD
jgi:hypothetical protein